MIQRLCQKAKEVFNMKNLIEKINQNNKYYMSEYVFFDGEYHYRNYIKKVLHEKQIWI